MPATGRKPLPFGRAAAVPSTHRCSACLWNEGRRRCRRSCSARFWWASMGRASPSTRSASPPLRPPCAGRRYGSSTSPAPTRRRGRPGGRRIRSCPSAVSWPFRRRPRRSRPSSRTGSRRGVGLRRAHGRGPPRPGRLRRHTGRFGEHPRGLPGLRTSDGRPGGTEHTVEPPGRRGRRRHRGVRPGGRVRVRGSGAAESAGAGDARVGASATGGSGRGRPAGMESGGCLKGSGRRAWMRR